MKLVFDIDHHGELGAGIYGYSDTVIITVCSGNPGGEPKEFNDFMTECLTQWFDGARVKLIDVGFNEEK